MTKGRKTTQEERAEIVAFCIEHNKDYGLTVETYNVSYQQIYAWVRKYEEGGVDKLKDNRGRTKPVEEMTEVEKLKAEMKILEAKNRQLEIENAFIKKIVDTWIGVLIFILIGIVVGSWVYSGTVPMLIYYGIKLIHPSFIPLMAFIVTSFLSIFTGTSWGSASTAGVAFIGIAQATNTPLPLVAGAVISGAYLEIKILLYLILQF